MPSNPTTSRQAWTYGRGFASVDPERQREVTVGYGRSGPIETAPPREERAPRTRPAWGRVQAERESPNFEGSSSRRSR